MDYKSHGLRHYKTKPNRLDFLFVIPCVKHDKLFGLFRGCEIAVKTKLINEQHITETGKIRVVIVIIYLR